MKNIHHLLTECGRLDVKLWLQDNQLRYSAPKQALSPELLAQMRQHKAEIIQFLETTNLAANSNVESIQPVSRDTELPLSFAQQRIWLINQIEGTNAIYNLSGTLKISGALQVSILEKSIQEIMQRHEILRTTFKTVNGEPIQVISPSVNFTLPLVECPLPEASQIYEIQQLIIEEAQRPFDLTNGLLWRCTLLHLEQTEYLLQVVMHHIVSDGWSIGIFFRELNAIYTATSQGNTSPLDKLAIQYADFAAWQKKHLQGEYLAQQLSYWKQQLIAASTLLQLPSRPRPPLQTFVGNSQSFTLDHNLTESLKTLSQQTEVTPFMLLLAVFNTLLYRYTQQTDILIGSPIANRNHSQSEGLIGCFVNTLVLRTDLSGNPSFRELLQRVRAVALGAYAHQDLPFEKLVEELQPTRDLSYSPLFQVMFVLQNAFDTRDIQLGDLGVEGSRVDTQTSQFDLTMEFTQQDWGLVGRVEYNTDLFDASTITRLIGHFQTLLTGIVANPDQCLSDLPLLTPQEYLQFKQWNQTTVDYPQNTCIHQLFEQQVKRTPDAVALVFENQQLTYRELNQRANQLGHYLQKLGVKPDVLVGICVERSIEMLVGLLGILKAGGAYVPLDPAYPGERLALMLSDSQVSVLLTQDKLVARLPQHQAVVICLDTDSELISHEILDNPANNLASENLAYVIYTSGSTGKPKGVQILHRSVINFLKSMECQPGLTQSDILVAVTSISFDIAALELYLPLIIGARLVLVSRTVAADAKELSQQINSSGATVMQATPATWRMLLTAGWQINTQLKILCGGEALSHELAEQLLEKGASLWNLYGPTETTIWSTVCQIDKTHLSNSIMPIGCPIINTQIYILDSYNQQTPIGIPGELHIGGTGLARGYLNRPELTEEKFINHPVWGRLYKTGDLARYLPDGLIEYLGRIDNQVKIRGFRIELGEIEAALSQHSAVRQVVVIVREDEPGDKRLVAYIVSQNSSDEITYELRRFLEDKLPNYIIPSVFVPLEALPLTPNGKVDRRALPIPESRPQLEEVYISPQTEIEEFIASVWQDVLQLKQVGINDNFFNLGGHSLLLVRIQTKLHNILNKEISIIELFKYPTIKALAQYLDQKIDIKSGKEPKIKHIPRDRNLPLSFAQQRMWFLDQLDFKSVTTNISGALRINGALQVSILEQSFKEIIQRHEILRTTLQTVNGQPIQVIAPNVNFTLPLLDLRMLAESEQEMEVQQLAQAEACQVFNLSRDLLLRVKLVCLNATEHIMLMTIHHIVSDGWSIGIFFRELNAIYTATSQGNTSPLDKLAIQYADFAAWQKKHLQGEYLAQQLSYWKQQLIAASTLLQLPSRPRPPLQTFVGNSQSFTLDKNLTNTLKTLSEQTEVTPFMLLLAAFNTLLYRYTQQTDILIGSPIANRNHSQSEGLIGCFVNTLVLRTDLSGNPSFQELLQRVRAVALGAYAHQDLPFEKLVEELQPTRDLSYSPLFQVMFVLQNAFDTRDIQLGDLGVEGSRVDTQTSQFDLTMEFTQQDWGLVGRVEYNTDLFDASTITRLIGHFQTLLTGIVANPDQCLSDLPLLTPQEYLQFQQWNQTKVDYPQNTCIHQLFEQQVKRTPDAVALVFENQQLTYRELNQRANQLGHYLQKLGVKPDVLVGICVERSIEMLVGLLGILKAGGAYVPLDPAYPGERLALMLSDSQVSVLLTQDKLVARLPQHQAVVICLDTDSELISHESLDNPANNLTSDNLAYVIYTSGSTGKPKGVMVQHNSLVNYTHYAIGEYEVSSSDRILQFASISFDTAAEEIFPCLAQGATLVLRTDEMLSSIPTFLKYCADWQLTILDLPTAFWHQIIAEMSALSLTLPDCVRLVIIGGEKALPERLTTWQQVTPNVRLINSYGPTEATIVTTTVDLSQQAGGQDLPIGKPISNAQTYILDPYLQLVPVGVPGELYIGGVGVARGYLNLSELTSQKFISYAFHDIPETRLYRTGDLVRYRSDGTIEFLGRVDNQVKIRGFRIELGEIETVLAKHSDVLDCTVIAQEDQTKDNYLVAYVVLKGEKAELKQLYQTNVTQSELRRFLQEALPAYMIPAIFVFLEQLPLTPNGKLDRRSLPVPDMSLRESGVNFVAPRNPLEEQLATIWADVLKLEKVGIYDNFFALGGHSLLATQVISRLRAVLEMELPLRSLFERPTVAGLSDRLETMGLKTKQGKGRKEIEL